MGEVKGDMKGKREIILRFVALCLLLLTACLIRTNSETKVIFDTLERKATFRSIYIYVIQFYTVCVAAGYNFLQIMRCWFMSEEKHANLTPFKHLLLAITFFLDQVGVYLVFAINSASVTVSLFAVTGNESMQWQKLCDMYTRFCFHVGGFLIVGFVATLVLGCISSLSSFFLFRLYSSSQILRLKTVNAY